MISAHVFSPFAYLYLFVVFECNKSNKNRKTKINRCVQKKKKDVRKSFLDFGCYLQWRMTTCKKAKYFPTIQDVVVGTTKMLVEIGRQRKVLLDWRLYKKFKESCWVCIVVVESTLGGWHKLHSSFQVQSPSYYTCSSQKSNPKLSAILKIKSFSSQSSYFKY